MKTKKCSKCGELKSINEFHKNKSRKDGFNYWCKECSKGRYKNNPEQAKSRIMRFKINNPNYYREYKKNNPPKVRKYNKKYYKNNTEKVREINKKWSENNPEKIKLMAKRNMKKRYSNPKFKLSHRISIAMRRSLKGNKRGKHWESLVNYTVEDLRKHLEHKFKKGMSWQNISAWHIDHIEPVSSFTFTSHQNKEFKKCWALDNLQPLWACENWLKGARIC